MDKITDLKNIVINTLDLNKAQDIITIDLKDKSSMADYMIIASGTSSRHIQSLSEQVLEKLIDNGTKLIFTVDCGTLSFDAIDYAFNNEIDVIVLDHHQSEVNLPSAFSIVNPNRLDDQSNLNYLSRSLRLALGAGPGP